MIVGPKNRALALAGILALGLSACGGEKATTSSPSQGGSATTATSSQSSASSQATTSASEAASSQGSSDAPAGGDKAYTAAQLDAMFEGVKIGGKPVGALKDQLMAGARQADANNLKSIQKANISPAACKEASVVSAKQLAQRTAVSGAGGGEFMIFLRSMPSASVAKDAVEGARATATACASMTGESEVSGTKMSLKATSKLLQVESATSENEVAQTTTTTMNGQAMPTSVAVGHVGNVLIQVTSMGKSASEAELSAALEVVAKGVAAKA